MLHDWSVYYEVVALMASLQDVNSQYQRSKCCDLLLCDFMSLGYQGQQPNLLSLVTFSCIHMHVVLSVGQEVRTSVFLFFSFFLFLLKVYNSFRIPAVNCIFLIITCTFCFPHCFMIKTSACQCGDKKIIKQNKNIVLESCNSPSKQADLH